MSITLRPYQQEAVANIRAAFAEFRRVLFVMSTGAGKTIVFSYIAQHSHKKLKRVLIVAHRREICDQISSALWKFGVPHGIIAPGERRTYDSVQVGMVQTVARRLGIVREPDLLIIDEAAHAVVGSWKKVQDHFPHAKILGVTATPLRLSGEGMKLAFDKMVLGPAMKWLINEGNLCNYTYYGPTAQIDISSFKTKMGDYAIEDIEKAVDKTVITGSAVTHYTKLLNGKPAIVFCTTIKHAEHVRDQFLAAGYRAENIDGKMSAIDRRTKINALATGQLNILTSVMVLTEGVDIPIASGCIILRPTKSLALYLQMVGRVLRPKPDGSSAIILDHVGACNRLGLPDENRNWNLEGKIKTTPKSPMQCSRCYIVARSRPSCADTECPAKKPASEGRDPPKEVDGELRAVQDPYVWAKGCNIALAQGEEWKALLRHTQGKHERLMQIARIRGYSPKWAWMVMKGNWL